ncbi:hypothetical protein SAMN02745124_03811 [Desulfofustis glycolicus DSM 9705]|uniref:Uncharacterized protein n=1 Tax=Desulfofustis glycolicus DSM 9705 TaxID=1121409 RepID=A0A1M5YAV1_9BACT|nr:hypothetical protein SAMN02745124_03811 [Desulfofustis glycolicus DSM 9705]
MPVISSLPAAANRVERLFDAGVAVGDEVLAGAELSFFVFISLQNAKKRIIFQFYLCRRRNLHFLMPAFFLSYLSSMKCLLPTWINHPESTSTI